MYISTVKIKAHFSVFYSSITLAANKPLPVSQCLAKIVWTLLTTDILPHDSSMLVESLKAYVVSKSALTSCALCTELVPHNLRTNLLLCKCKAKDVASTLVVHGRTRCRSASCPTC